MGDNTQNPQGKAKGGIARAESLTPEQRKEIAKKAAKARHETPTATHIGELVIGDVTLPCAVLPDGTRLISQGGMTTAFGPVTGGWQMRKRAADEHSGELPPFLVAASLKGFISSELRTLVSTQRKYKDPRGGPIRIGMDATLIPKICEVWLKARDAKALTKIQLPVAERADVLMRGLAHTGIIALVDEATGYEKDRIAGSLAKILEIFIAKELQPWVKTFPPEYYEQLFRLRGLAYSSDSVKRPQYFGVLTNDIVYKRLAPGVLDELKRVKEEEGRPRDKLFQRLTENVGYPKLREHLGAVVATMQLSDNYNDFKGKLDRIRPRFPDIGENMSLPLSYEDEADDGKGI